MLVFLERRNPISSLSSSLKVEKVRLSRQWHDNFVQFSLTIMLHVTLKLFKLKLYLDLGVDAVSSSSESLLQHSKLNTNYYNTASSRLQLFKVKSAPFPNKLLTFLLFSLQQFLSHRCHFSHFLGISLFWLRAHFGVFLFPAPHQQLAVKSQRCHCYNKTYMVRCSKQQQNFNLQKFNIIRCDNQPKKLLLVLLVLLFFPNLL